MTTYNEVNNAYNKAHHTHMTRKYPDTSYVTTAALNLVDYVNDPKNSGVLTMNPDDGYRSAVAWLIKDKEKDNECRF